MDGKKTKREKARRELRKTATSYLKQILEATHHETTAVWPLTSHLKTGRQTRRVGLYWRSKNELSSDVLLWTPTNGSASVSRKARIYLHKLCAGSLEELPGAMDDRDGWRESVREIRAVSVTWWWWWWWCAVKNFNLIQIICTHLYGFK